MSERSARPRAECYETPRRERRRGDTFTLRYIGTAASRLL